MNPRMHQAASQLTWGSLTSQVLHKHAQPWKNLRMYICNNLLPDFAASYATYCKCLYMAKASDKVLACWVLLH